VLIGAQEPTKGIDVFSIHGNPAPPYEVLVSCNFNGHNNCTNLYGTVTTPVGYGAQNNDVTMRMIAGNTTATIGNQITGHNWTDGVIGDYEFHTCSNSLDNCTGVGVSEHSSSNQFANSFAGGLGLAAGAHLGNTAANKDFTGTCTMALGVCPTVFFANPYASNPVCTAAWQSGTLTGIVKAAVTTSMLNITSSVTTDTATIGYICTGNPN